MKHALLLLALGTLLLSTSPLHAEGWSPVQRIEFTSDELPPNLYSQYTGEDAPSVLRYRLPAGYSESKDYPLLVYVPGFHGHPGGNLRNAVDIADGRECVVASLPLFQADMDSTEYGRGLIIGYDDYPVLSSAYRVMFEALYEAVPNIDHERSALVGFSNGAIAMGVLISSHDEYLLERFGSFCLVEHGMYHLTDLHKSLTRDRRFLLMVGDESDYGRDLKLRAARLVADSFSWIKLDIELRIMEDTGHELTDACKREIGEWVFQ